MKKKKKKAVVVLFFFSFSRGRLVKGEDVSQEGRESLMRLEEEGEEGG